MASNRDYSSASGLRSSLNGCSLPTELFFKVNVKVTLGLAAYRQSVFLGVKLLETHNQRFFSPK
jgi:hypothetical protein